MSELQSTNETKIRWSASYKANMGNYETLGLEASVETNTRPGEKVSEGLERVYSVVEAALLEKFTEIKKQLARIEKEVAAEKESNGGANNEAEGS